ncbi:response regulator [Candidatus Magnetobacterium casense]|uniref:Two-component system response regulator n=1 Tax=Candidatus Magnetobacterium casense TaxID=1455061 RepID=A0ABS6S182_9BACT|nr:two-component system response regulator [Candidatus Magnetobacterium casensis]MBV6342576.1 two-component system response regulator [Candidatus Magnetobacterium casensis]
MNEQTEQIKRDVVLVVDDTPDNLTLMSGLLKDKYKVKVANSGERALKIANSDSPPDLILLDIMMPEMDGYEVLRRLKTSPATGDIPVIFLTAKAEVEDERLGLSLGAVDYITKPISPPIVMARVGNHLQLKAMRDFLRQKNEFLEQEVRRRTEEITAIQDVTVLALGSLAETRDSDTGNHIRRTQHYVIALANHLRTNSRFGWFLTDKNIVSLFKTAPLHDIGKVGIPDNVLLKPGKLDDNEFAVMKTHTVLGKKAIEDAEQRLGTEVEFLRFAKEIALSHHERWDGAGYPEGLSGDDIPILARIMAVADVYDALICKRVYKTPMTHEQAKNIIVQGKGTQFDPDVVDAFVAQEEAFIKIARQFSDK